MSNNATGLLDVLKETLALQRRVCQLMAQHKSFLVAGREGDAQPILDDIDTVCAAVIDSERRRQSIVQVIAHDAGFVNQPLTANELSTIPALLSIREELAETTSDLRTCVRRIVQLRDEIQALAQHAKAYSDMMLAALQQASQAKPYGKPAVRNSRFISIQT